jgi:hypothetical protein
MRDKSASNNQDLPLPLAASSIPCFGVEPARTVQVSRCQYLLRDKRAGRHPRGRRSILAPIYAQFYKPNNWV